MRDLGGGHGSVHAHLHFTLEGLEILKFEILKFNILKTKAAWIR